MSSFVMCFALLGFDPSAAVISDNPAAESQNKPAMAKKFEKEVRSYGKLRSDAKPAYAVWRRGKRRFKDPEIWAQQADGTYQYMPHVRKEEVDFTVRTYQSPNQ